jgi:hypothetical protein
MAPNPTEVLIEVALRAFLVAILPPGTAVVLGQDNRVPEPAGTDFVTMTPLRRPRLSTNVDDDSDVKFTASIAGTAMTVTAVDRGSISAGATVFGVGVADGTKIASGPGGVGVYEVTVSQTLSARTLSSGATNVTQATQVVYQLDVHGPSSADNAQVISTLLRDGYASEFFESQDPAIVAPLHADDPRQAAFVNDQQQYEDRWTVEALLQVNPVVSVPQQYADGAEVDIISVDAEYAP